ncbi:MmcQ/YjbR family DNA-binding protein [Aquincola sp. S2]|uniref:MmcQ/YjbR family DNA-binding protein n=1 Tax=Pseudaquabacterium terrae TaxID=2732868 RepID=A0ABX2EUR0_9BURK|nr:MmcQ/YjbR family DNA-binding protein [Aquabacterium terrae]NRF72469.1 MmcQ/YjbR family DNA-binding protein [Aquabacterium terrae]
MKVAQVRRHALSLPEVTEAPHFQYSSFRVRGKIFVTVPPDEEHIHVFVPEQEREIALALEPECLEKLHWGGKVVGLRVLLNQAKPAQVNRLISQAWASKAPKKLVAVAESSRVTKQ